MRKTNKWKKPKIRANKLTKWNWMVSHPKKLKMGKNVDIGAYTYIQSEFGVEIEDNVQIGAHCCLYTKNSENKTKGKIKIFEGALIGAHTIILPGTTVLPGTKIRAQSILKGGIYK